MSNKMLLLLLIITLVNGQASVSFITPTSYQDLIRGNTYVIEWTIFNGPITLPATNALVLYKSGNPVYAIPCAEGALTSTSTKCTWTIPDDNNLFYGSSSFSFYIRLNYDTSEYESVSIDIEPAEGSITIVQPENYADWYKGSTRNIEWIFDPSTGIDTVDITHKPSSGNTPIVIATNVSNTGSYQWTIPSNLVKATYYLTIAANKKLGRFDAITAQRTYSIEPQPLTLTFVSPVAGNSETWFFGTQRTIRWKFNVEAIVETVKIEFVQSGSVVSVIASETPNNGSFNWVVPNDLNPNYSGKIRITTVKFDPRHESTYWDSGSLEVDFQKSDFIFSNPFSGSTWGLGEVRNIEWITNGEIYTVKIELFEYSTLRTTIVPETDNLGSFLWTVDTNLNTRSTYKIRITALTFSVNTTAVYKDSNTFDIEAKGEDDDVVVRDITYNQQCADKCFATGAQGDSLCSCTRACGRRCLPGYKESLSGYDPISDAIRGRIFYETFVGKVYTDTSILGTTFYQPERVTVVGKNSQTLSSGAKISESLQDYQEETTFGFSVPIPVKSVTLTLGVDYQQAKQTYKSAKSYIGFTNYDRSTYTISPSLSSFVLTDEFTRDLNGLPTSYDSVKYRTFLDTYGPYYFKSVTFGVRAKIQTTIQSCVFKSLDKQSISASLEASGQSAIDGASVSGGNSKENILQCLQGYSSSTVNLIGGDINKFKCQRNDEGIFVCQGKWEDYAKTADQNPGKLAYELLPINNLVNGTYADNMKKAIDDYINEAKGQLENVPKAPPVETNCECSSAQMVIVSVLLCILVVISTLF